MTSKRNPRNHSSAGYRRQRAKVRGEKIAHVSKEEHHRNSDACQSHKHWRGMMHLYEVADIRKILAGSGEGIRSDAGAGIDTVLKLAETRGGSSSLGV